MFEQKPLSVSISLSVDAVNLILEGLLMLPLGRSRMLFDAIKDEAEKQFTPTQTIAAIPSERKDTKPGLAEES